LLLLILLLLLFDELLYDENEAWLTELFSLDDEEVLLFNELLLLLLLLLLSCVGVYCLFEYIDGGVCGGIGGNSDESGGIIPGN
jgi:hypothetical protein